MIDTITAQRLLEEIGNKITDLDKTAKCKVYNSHLVVTFKTTKRLTSVVSQIGELYGWREDLEFYSNRNVLTVMFKRPMK